MTPAIARTTASSITVKPRLHVFMGGNGAGTRIRRGVAPTSGQMGRTNGRESVVRVLAPTYGRGVSRVSSCKVRPCIDAAGCPYFTRALRLRFREAHHGWLDICCSRLRSYLVCRLALQPTGRRTQRLQECVRAD